MQQRAIDCIIEHITVGTLISNVNMKQCKQVWKHSSVPPCTATTGLTIGFSGDIMLLLRESQAGFRRLGFSSALHSGAVGLGPGEFGGRVNALGSLSFSSSPSSTAIAGQVLCLGRLLPRGEGGSGVVGSAMMCSLLHCVKVKSIWMLESRDFSSRTRGTGLLAVTRQWV